MILKLYIFIFATCLCGSYALSLSVRNACPVTVFLNTETANGSIRNNVNVPTTTTIDMEVADNWEGAINVGTGCNSEGTSCTTGGPIWDGRTPFSRAEFSFSVNEVTYSLSNLFGINVGIAINTTDPSCPNPGCGQVEANGGCPVIGPEGAGERSCFSPCCSSAADCENGALESGGCVDNVGLGPNTGFHHNRCPNLISFPNDVGSGDHVQFSCGNTDLLLNLCASIMTHF